jgi:uncharacterized protein (DUF362 family)
MGSKVYIGNTNEYNSYSAVKKAFSDLNVKFNFKNAVIKLNICSLKLRETGATSDPIVVEQIIKFLNENNVHVTLVESDSASKDVMLAFDYLGFKSLEKKYDVSCINLSSDQIVEKKIDGYYFNTVKVPKTLAEAEFLITHPKLKTHSSMKVKITCALKNQFGCLMNKNKAIYHPYIHEVIVDLNRVLKPDLALVDSIIAMTGYGPTDGVPQRLNLFLASQDLVAVDALGAKIFGYNPNSIKYLMLAQEKGLGNINSEVIGDKVRNVSVDMHVNNTILRSFEVLSSIGIKPPG